MTDPALVRASEALTSAVERLGTKVDDFAAKDRKRRAQLIVLGLSVALDILLSVGLFYLVDHNKDLVDRVAKQSATIHQTCIERNEFSKKNRVLWDGLFATVQASERALPQEVVDAVNKQLDETFVQTDCTK